MDKEKNIINEYNVPQDKWGVAISYTYEKEDGTMWVGNGEYESRVNFCPITGKAALKQMKKFKFIKNANGGTIHIYDESI